MQRRTKEDRRVAAQPSSSRSRTASLPWGWDHRPEAWSLQHHCQPWARQGPTARTCRLSLCILFSQVANALLRAPCPTSARSRDAGEQATPSCCPAGHLCPSGTEAFQPVSPPVCRGEVTRLPDQCTVSLGGQAMTSATSPGQTPKSRLQVPRSRADQHSTAPQKSVSGLPAEQLPRAPVLCLRPVPSTDPCQV